MGEDAQNNNEPAKQPQALGHVARTSGSLLFCRARCDGASHLLFSRADWHGGDQLDDLRGRMTREEALAIVRQIEGLASTARRDDTGAQHDIMHLVDQLREAPGVQDVVREKVASIAAWTDILFSDRKRATYGGDEEVTELLLHDCERLRAAIRAD
jgi:hypothetical protein